jgi:RND family efflux transporter MFP subunit
MVIKMKKIFLSVAAISIVGIMLFGCNKSEEKSGEKKQLNTDTIAVQIATVESKELKISKSFSGSLEGEEQVNIVAKIPERIVSIKVKVGEVVAVGTSLIELDKSGASSQYYQAEAGFLNASKDFERMKALFKEGAVSQQMLDGAQTVFNIAKANFEAAKSTVELTTPISGVVTAINVNIGDLATPGVPLVVVASINRMKVIFNAGENDIASFGIGQTAEIYSELKPSLIQSGRISQISNSADVQTRSFEIKSLFNNTRDRWFKPGMFCRVKLELRSQKNSVIIPNLAVVNTNDAKGVFVIDNGVAKFKNIETGLSDGNYTEVTTGLKAGETIATIGMNNLKDGVLVHISK